MAVTHEKAPYGHDVGMVATEIPKTDSNGVAAPSRKREGTFPSLLAAYRRRSGMSMTVLAAHAGFDHSYVSRVEAGVRNPSREAVLALAGALGLDDLRRDRLLASFGFMPLDPARLVDGMLQDEPTVAVLYRVLTDPETDDDRRTMIRGVVSALVGMETT